MMLLLYVSRETKSNKTGDRYKNGLLQEFFISAVKIEADGFL